MTLKLYAKGAKRRSIADGKTPKPFRGIRISSGQFIYSRIDARNGAFAIVGDELNGAVVSKDFPVFDIDSRVDPGYLMWVIASPEFYEQIGRLSFGATNRQRVGEASLLALQIPVPPLTEQRRIASILDEVDQLRIKRRRGLSLGRELIDQQFLEMFGSDETPETTVSDLLAKVPNAIRTGPFGSQLLHSEFSESGVPVLGIDNVVTNDFVAGYSRFISDAKYAELKRYTVRGGDVLITIMGTVGRVAVAPSDIETTISTKHLCCITPDRNKILPEYLQQYFLLHPVARRYLGQTSKGAIMDGLNMGIIRDLPVHVPSMSAQKRFVQLRRQTEATLRAQGEHLSLLDTLFVACQKSIF